MKALKPLVTCISIALIAMLTSCQKTQDVQSHVNANAQTDNSAAFKFCFITHTQDDIFGDALDLFYSANHRLDSINENGTTVTLKYDKLNRLKKAMFGDYAWFDYKYKAGDFLPVAFNYNYPYFGGLIAIDSFRYNWLGQISARISHNVFHPEYNFIERYTYNERGNAIKVDIKAHNGGTIYKPGYTEFTTSKYDNKLNLLASNPWLRFIFFYTDYDFMPFSFMGNSISNASSYKWVYDNAGDSYSVTSTFTYNAQGFPNVISMDWYDDAAGMDLGIFTRTSYTSCDNLPLSPANALNKTSFIQKKKGMNKFGLPSVIKR